MKQPAHERRAKTGVIRVLEAKLVEMDAHLAEVASRRRDVVALLKDLRSATAYELE
jgi:hypothetical protein